MHLLNDLEKIDIDLFETLQAYPAKIGESIENYRFREALGYLMELSSIGNKSVSKKMHLGNLPKILPKINTELKTPYNLPCNLTANLAFLAEPFLPFTAQKLQKALGLGKFYWYEPASKIYLSQGKKYNQ